MPSLTQITQLLESACSVHAFSAYSLYAERAGRTLELNGGVTTYWPGAAPVTASTFFDIGSITKSITTASTLARLFSRKEANLSDSLGDHVPVLRGSPYAPLRLDDLLSHGAGLIDWYPMFRERGETPLVEWFLQNEAKLVVAKPRERTAYSDLGFLLLGLVLQQKYGVVSEALRREVKEPLGLSEVEYGPRTARNETVATEFDEASGTPFHGVVFDENSRSLGGVAPQAGLFATARGLAPFCRAWLSAVAGSSAWIDPEVAQRMTTPAGHIAGSTWAYGFDTKSPEYSSAGKLFSPRTFGHLGYPGCSVWMDPVNEGFAVFFTNRVHPSRYDERIRKLRPLVHDEIATWWRSSND